MRRKTVRIPRLAGKSPRMYNRRKPFLMVFNKNQKKFAASSDRDLVQLFLGNRDEQALECLLARYENLVFSFIPKRLSQEDKEDILAECLSKMALGLKSFDFTRAKLSTWVGTITKNRVVDHLRAVAYRNKCNTTDWDERIHRGTSSFTADGDVHLAELREAAMEVLQKINPRDRQIVSMYVFERFKYVDIADQTGLPLGTVKTVISKRMSFLRDELKKKYPHNGGIFAGKNRLIR